MTCPYVSLKSVDAFYAERLQATVRTERVPVTASLELTARCNLRCVHCWIASPGCRPEPAPEMTTAEVLEVLGQVADAGCLWLLLTGGEPLLRPDFAEIYAAAKRRGMLVTLFTNGTRVTREVADLLAELPPRQIEITLYGATEETYARVTGVDGALARCRQGIELLLERHLPLKLKTVVQPLNLAELPAMRQLAEAYGVGFYHDEAVACGVHGETHPLEHRLTPEQVIDVIAADAKLVAAYRSYLDRFGVLTEFSDRVFQCGAGVSTLHVDAQGRLSPCMMLRDRPVDIRGGRLVAVWRTDIEERLLQTWSTGSRCRTCALGALCAQCPAWAWLEHGDLESPVDFLCETAHRLAGVLGLSTGSEDGTDERQESGHAPAAV